MLVKFSLNKQINSTSNKMSLDTSPPANTQLGDSDCSHYMMIRKSNDARPLGIGVHMYSILVGFGPR